MTNIPIRAQILPKNPLAFVQACIQNGKQVSGEDILSTIEQSIERQLPEDVQNIVRRAIISAVKTRGRPSKVGASLDFALEKLDRRYPALLRYEQRKKDRLLKSGKAAQKGESPLLSYKEPDGEDDDLRHTDLKQRFYHYLQGIDDDQQVIIIENTDPPADVQTLPQAIKFTGNPDEGRAGLFSTSRS